MDCAIMCRLSMIATFDFFRDTLEDLGGGLGSPIRRPVRWCWR